MTNIIETTYEKVKLFLQTIYGEKYDHYVAEIDQKFVISKGSAVVNVSVKPWHEEDCIVQALAHVVTGARMTPELIKFLLRENSRAPFGAFGLYFDDTITFSHSVAGTNLDLNELGITVRHVAFMADEYDDLIRDIAGGRRAVDGNASIMSDIPVDTKKIPAKKRAVQKKKITKKKKVVAKKKPIVKKQATNKNVLSRKKIVRLSSRTQAGKKATKKKIVRKK